MAQVGTRALQEIDHNLHWLTVRWQSLAEVDSWDYDDQTEFLLDWPTAEEGLRRLERWRQEGAMNPEQAARYQELRNLVEERRPLLERLLTG